MLKKGHKISKALTLPNYLGGAEKEPHLSAQEKHIGK